MKDYTVMLCIGASFDDRSKAYELLEAFHQFLEQEVPVENFELQDIKLGFRAMPSLGDPYAKRNI